MLTGVVDVAVVGAFSGELFDRASAMGVPAIPTWSFMPQNGQGGDV
ncbi:hypothetical protein O1R50_19310 [Glycomyces luteolus]|uniref:Uncharacterized protein n=1 Tax=Glycomyces luteolus TaxID=2670330 RepID=A0A9X3PE24_9ACTN|nr:hypothetical protein [Glycomyces luteolus]MDA1361785.1 hypothetical protein [Glycomyces luteolus]